jgi:hypothetical protein
MIRKGDRLWRTRFHRLTEMRPAEKGTSLAFAPPVQRNGSIGRINTPFLKSHSHSHPHGTGPPPRIIVRCGGPAGKKPARHGRIPTNSSLQTDRCPRQLLPALLYLLRPCKSWRTQPSAATGVVFSYGASNRTA